jgi:hypothetical protein
VNEPPADGRANRAVCDILATALCIPASAVSVTRGQTSRDKTLRIAGDTALLTSVLETM